MLMSCGDRLRKEQAAQADRWALVFQLLGRAIEAALGSDREAVIFLVNLLADAEYEACGDCDITGALLDQIAPDVAGGMRRPRDPRGDQ